MKKLKINNINNGNDDNVKHHPKDTCIDAGISNNSTEQNLCTKNNSIESFKEYEKKIEGSQEKNIYSELTLNTKDSEKKRDSNLPNDDIPKIKFNNVELTSDNDFHSPTDSDYEYFTESDSDKEINNYTSKGKGKL